MHTKTPLHRRPTALTGIAALGLVTTVMLAPAAHADTERDGPEESTGTTVVAEMGGAAETGGGETTAETAPESATGTGEEAAADTGDQPATGTGEEPAAEAGDELLVAPEAGPSDADPAEEAPAAGSPEQDGLCTDGAAGDPQAAGTGTAAPTDAGLGDATAESSTDGTDGTDSTDGTDGAAVPPEVATGGDGTATDPGCAATTPDQAGTGPGAPAGDDTQLPVGGVDAGRGEAPDQNMVLPIATAGAVAAAVSLGAYTLVRRRRSAV